MILLSDGWNNFVGLVLFAGAAYGMYRWVLYRKGLKSVNRVVGKGGGSSDDGKTQKH